MPSILKQPRRAAESAPHAATDGQPQQLMTNAERLAAYRRRREEAFDTHAVTQPYLKNQFSSSNTNLNDAAPSKTGKRTRRALEDSDDDVGGQQGGNTGGDAMPAVGASAEQQSASGSDVMGDSDLDDYFRACAASDDEQSSMAANWGRRGADGSGSDDDDSDRGLSGGRRAGSSRGRVGGGGGDYSDPDDEDGSSSHYYDAMQGVSPMRGRPSLSLTTPHRNLKRHRNTTAAGDHNHQAAASMSSKAANPSKATSSSFTASSSSFSGYAHMHHLTRPETFRTPHAQSHLSALQRGLLDREEATTTAVAPLGLPHTSQQLTSSATIPINGSRINVSRAEAPLLLTRELAYHVAHQEPSLLYNLSNTNTTTNPSPSYYQQQRWELSSAAMGLCRSLCYGEGVGDVVGSALGAASAARLLEGHCMAIMRECDDALLYPSPSTRFLMEQHQRQQQLLARLQQQEQHQQHADGKRKGSATPAPAPPAVLPPIPSPPTRIDVLCATVLRRFADMCGHIVVTMCRPIVPMGEGGPTTHTCSTMGGAWDGDGDDADVALGAPPLPPAVRERIARRNGVDHESAQRGPPPPPPPFSRPIDLTQWSEEAHRCVNTLLGIFDKCALAPMGGGNTNMDYHHHGGLGAKPPLQPVRGSSVGGGAGGRAHNSASPPRSTTAFSSSSSPPTLSFGLQKSTRVASLLDALLEAIDHAQLTCRRADQQRLVELYVYCSWPLFELLGQGVTGTTDVPMASVSIFNNNNVASAANNGGSGVVLPPPNMAAVAGSLGEIYASEDESYQFESLLRAAVGLGPSSASRHLQSHKSSSAATASSSSVGGLVATAAEISQLVGAARELRGRGVRAGSATVKPTSSSSSSNRLMPTLHEDDNSNWGSNPASARTSGVAGGDNGEHQYASSTVGTVAGGGGAAAARGHALDDDAVTVIGQAPNYGAAGGATTARRSHADGNGGSSSWSALLRTFAGNVYTREVFNRLREGGTEDRVALSRREQALAMLQRGEEGEEEEEEALRGARGDGLKKVRRYGTDGASGRFDYIRANGDHQRYSSYDYYYGGGGGGGGYSPREDRHAAMEALFGEGLDDTCDDVIDLLVACEESDGGGTRGTAQNALAQRGMHHHQATSEAQLGTAGVPHPYFLKIVDAPFPSLIIAPSINAGEDAEAFGEEEEDQGGGSALPLRVRIDGAVTCSTWLRACLVEPLTRIVARQQLLVVKALLRPSRSSATHRGGFGVDSQPSAMGLIDLIHLFRHVCFLSHASMVEVFMEQLINSSGGDGSSASEEGEGYASPSASFRWYDRLVVDAIRSPYTVSSSQRITAAFVEAKARIPHSSHIHLVVMPRVGPSSSAGGGGGGGGGGQQHATPSIPRQIMNTFEALRFHFTVPFGLYFMCPNLRPENSRDNVSVWLALDTADIYSKVFASLALLRYCKARLLQQMKGLYAESKARATAAGRGGGGGGANHHLHHIDTSGVIRRNYILRVVVDILFDFAMGHVEGAAKRYEAVCVRHVASMADLKAAHQGFVQSLRVSLLLPPPTEPTGSVLTTQLAAMREAKQLILLNALAEVEGGAHGGIADMPNHCGVGRFGPNGYSSSVRGVGVTSLTSPQQHSTVENPTDGIDVIVSDFVAAAQRLPSTTTSSTAAASSSFASSSSSGTDYYSCVKPMLHQLTFNDYFTANSAHHSV